MKNITLAIASLFLLASCSEDSASALAGPVVQDQNLKVVRQVDFNNQSFILDYNQDRTLKKAESQNGVYTLAYQDGKISQVSGQMNDEHFEVAFGYDANNLINAISVNGVSKAVVYNEAGRYYEVIENPQTLARVKYLLDGNGDLMEIQSFGNQGNFIDGKTYYYESGQKGPLYNTNRVTLHLAMACKKQALYSCAFGGYRAFKHFAGAHSAPMIVQNTYDADGFVLGSMADEDNFATFTYIHI